MALAVVRGGTGDRFHRERALHAAPASLELRLGFKKADLTFSFFYGCCVWLCRLWTAQGFPVKQVNSR